MKFNHRKQPLQEKLPKLLLLNLLELRPQHQLSPLVCLLPPFSVTKLSVTHSPSYGLSQFWLGMMLLRSVMSLTWT